jgi:hypothetical protein
MNQPRLIRGLRIAVSAVGGLVCLLAGFMCYRSIRSTDVLAGCSAAGDCVSVVSAHGGVGFSGSPSLRALLQLTNWGNVENVLWSVEEDVKFQIDFFYNFARELGHLYSKSDFARSIELERRATELERLQQTAKVLNVILESELLRPKTNLSNSVFPNFSNTNRWKRSVVFIPYWFLAILSIALTVAPWIHWSKRFSLRSLLIATTLIAVLLAAASY